ncbi:hypothetical protein [Paludibacterium yongneupense]|uniref:hypothetical protein n=1 Tax=Paludibacterium yongneupense TaxID=400061 RepID=UPI0012EC7542|nr:hypothetical protein [Paludibacterium yongneupense]
MRKLINDPFSERALLFSKVCALFRGYYHSQPQGKTQTHKYVTPIQFLVIYFCRHSLTWRRQGIVNKLKRLAKKVTKRQAYYAKWNERFSQSREAKDGACQKG